MVQEQALTIIDRGTTYTIGTTMETSLLQALRQIPDILLDAPCGGNGSCGKCKVRILKGKVSPPQPEETCLLTAAELSQGIRLACRTYPLDNQDLRLTIATIQPQGTSQVMTGFSGGMPLGALRFHAEEIVLESPSVEDQRSLLTRLSDEVAVHVAMKNPRSLRKLQQQMGHPALRCLMDQGKAVSLLDPKENAFGCAIDIGTTTVVVYLVELLSGSVVGHRAALNAQKRYGADVISRIEAVSKQPKGSELLQQTIIRQLDQMAAELCKSQGIPEDSLVELCAVGNTTMLHLLLGVDPATIAVAPFTPVFTESLSCPVSQLGFKHISDTNITLPASIASYVGADITAGVFASGITRQTEPVLFLDIGTNGEIALWDGAQLYCCSSAAGPAFEGASILHGTGGITGAVSSVSWIRDDQGEVRVSYQTIEGGDPVGICGSGIIDATATLLELGLVDDTGAMLDSQEDRSQLIINTPTGNAFSIVASEEHPVFLTHKDVREVQLAKAAIAAGVRTLLHESGLSLEDLSAVVIAGGFGSYIDIGKAQRIGLLPPVAPALIKSVGNAAGQGAVLNLLDPTAKDAMEQIIHQARYIELSSSPQFMEYYIDEMTFPLEGTQAHG